VDHRRREVPAVSVRLWVGVALVAVALTPAAVFVWLLRSVGKAIERMNP
jgi:hypothetical protein